MIRNGPCATPLPLARRYPKLGSGAVGHQQNVRNEAIHGAIKPINELKPFTLDKFSTPGRFQDWKRRFKSFFLASNLDRAQIETQHAYLRNCISSQLSNLLDSQISEDLPVFVHATVSGTFDEDSYD